MKKIELEKLPQAVKRNEISKKEAARLIWEEVYMKPAQFGLMYFTEDQKSELLLEIHHNFEKIFDKFIPGTVPFRSFLIGCISKYKKHFLKNQTDKWLEKKTMKAYLIDKFDEEGTKYEISTQYEEEAVSEQEKKTFSDITEQEVNTHEQRNKRIAEITALILLMKACKDIDDETIESVCKFTGIDKSLVYIKIQELKESMSRKDEISEKLIQRRNNAYFYHRKYMQKMTASICPEARIEKLKKCYENQTKKWGLQNKNLMLRSISPSNEEVAKALGIRPRMVSFYINHVKDRKNMDKIKKLLTPNENEEPSEDEK